MSLDILLYFLHTQRVSGITMPETRRAYKKYNKILSNMYLVFYSSVIIIFFFFPLFCVPLHLSFIHTWSPCPYIVSFKISSVFMSHIYMLWPVILVVFSFIHIKKK